MLEYLEIENAGPADHLRLDLAPRLNLLTGDNGLGKSFLLDIAWWVLTNHWPADINSNLTSGRCVLPKIRISPAFMKFKKRGHHENLVEFHRQIQQWHRQPESLLRYEDQERLITRITIYAQADGSFALMDGARNYRTLANSGIGEFSIGGFPQPYPYVFTFSQVWNGLSEDDSILCDGLIRDWASWQKEPTDQFLFLKNVLKALSPMDQDVIEPSIPTRVMVDDVRNIPTIKMPYGDTPVIHTSAGMRRILSLAYFLVWVWSEHRRASLDRGLPLATEIVFLIDELDAHLHPKWQRTIVKSLMEVMTVLAPEVKVQLIAATHSPLVMASVEPFFDPAQDAWFDLDLNQQTGQVELTKRPWYRHGDADAWLKSEAFDQKSGYAPETELVLEEATQAMGNAETTREQAEVIDQKLRGLLGESDTFWIRWGYYLEQLRVIV